MREIVLRQFFEGNASAEELARDIVGTRLVAEPAGYRSSANYVLEPMGHSFVVEPGHIAGLVGATIDGVLSPDDLSTASFCLQVSDRFTWDADTPGGERVAEALFWLGAPEINWPLTVSTLSSIHDYLLTGENRLSTAES